MALSKKRWRLPTKGKEASSIRLDERAPRRRHLLVNDDKGSDDEGAVALPEPATARTLPRASSLAAASSPPTRVSTSSTAAYASPAVSSTPSA